MNPRPTPATEPPGLARNPARATRPTTDNPGRPVPVLGFPGAPSGVVSFAVADTFPGARCVLAPEFGYSPSSAAYTDGIRSLWRDHLGAREHLLVFAAALTPRHGSPVLTIAGPYAAEAREILEAIVTRNRPTHP